MLSAGVNLLRDSDTLRKVTVDYLYHSLRNPKEEVKSRIHQLRVVRSLDEKQYKVLKRELPYIVCGMFNPPYLDALFTNHSDMSINYMITHGWRKSPASQTLVDAREVLRKLGYLDNN